jgi:hypothetical protein
MDFIIMNIDSSGYERKLIGLHALIFQNTVVT